MRICLYTETALPTLGGQEMVVDALARQFLALGHEPMVLAPPPKRLRLADHEYPYPVIRHPRFVSTRRFVSWYTHWLWQLYRTRGFDVLHCHSVYPTGYLAALTRDRLNVPIVVTSHGGDVREGNCRLAKPGLPERHRMGIAGADALIAISQVTRAGFLRLCPEAANIVSIPNGVDLEPFAKAAARPHALDARIRPGAFMLYLGRLRHQKGVDLLLDAMTMIDSGFDTQLVVAGDGVERPALEAQAARLKLNDRVTFLGAVTGTIKTWLLQNAQFLVIPSRLAEGFGLVVTESYAAGRPVIGTAIPGLVELVTNGQNGMLVDPESPAQLAAAMTALLADPALARSYGENARRLAPGFSWTAVADRHIALYEQLREMRWARRAA